MSLRSKLFALTYDRQMAKVEKATLRALRESLLAAASGDVLEIGGGTGANLPYYRPEGGSLTITEPDTAMMRRLERRAREQAPLAKVLRAPAEDLPFEDATFDVAVSTMVLCGSATSRERCASSAGCCGPAGSCCSLSTSAPVIPGSPATRTA
jgi:ubiquinone/menaquinone biosynthesis C-methylase UbiE